MDRGLDVYLVCIYDKVATNLTTPQLLENCYHFIHRDRMRVIRLSSSVEKGSLLARLLVDWQLVTSCCKGKASYTGWRTWRDQGY